MTDALDYIKAFERNCPDVRLTKAERAELLRLFFMCMSEHPAFGEDPRLYDIAKEVTHKWGAPWTDPRTGITHPPPPEKKP